MPVICGGTNYYIESLLWKILMDESDDEKTTKRSIDDVENDPNKKFKVDDFDVHDNDLSTEELYAKLKEVDPNRAQELHPNERRKIIRSLQGNDKIMVQLI